MTGVAFKLDRVWQPFLVGASLTFMYATVLWKLGVDWWSDDNYSHGLLVPFVIAYIVWNEFEDLKRSVVSPNAIGGLLLIAVSTILLLGGTMAAVLFAQRISFVLMLVGVITFFFGARLVKGLAIPFILLLLAIPIPQILFNKIAFPLQLMASKIADICIRLLGIPAERRGNVIDIIPAGAVDVVSLEIVEACSGIRSLVTLITLSLILGYFTSDRQTEPGSSRSLIQTRDLQRIVLLTLAAIPVALATNAARVIATGLLTYYFGSDAVEGVWHDISGSVVFLTALGILFLLNIFLKRILARKEAVPFRFSSTAFAMPQLKNVPFGRTLILVVSIVLCGIFVNWFQYRGELIVERQPLSEMPRVFGTWEQRNDDIRFDADTESVLRASDYVMRDYYGPGKRLNVYVGYYSSQRSGATYHSPLSCLPGTGWEMKEPTTLPVVTPAGREITVNQYIVQQGEHKEYLIYWYQGRGRTNANEYLDKVYTSIDSLTKRRSDGGMVRIMTPVGKDPEYSLRSAIDLTGRVADDIGRFLPD